VGPLHLIHGGASARFRGDLSAAGPAARRPARRFSCPATPSAFINELTVLFWLLPRERRFLATGNTLVIFALRSVIIAADKHGDDLLIPAPGGVLRVFGGRAPGYDATLAVDGAR
jgi:hypothetical protein